MHTTASPTDRSTPIVRVIAFLAATAVAAGTLYAAPASARAEDEPDPDPNSAEGVPSVISSLGDSISEGTGSTGDGEGGWIPGSTRPRNSWTTGDWDGLNSHAQRLEALGADVVREPRSENGARMATDAVNQAMALPNDVEYVTVQLGGNDLCRPTVEEMTPTEQYAAELDAALAWIGANRPEAVVGVSSVPDIYRLWELRRSNPIAVVFWATGLVPCQSLLASPLSDDPDDQARRDAVRARSQEYNAAIEDVCASHANCRADGGAVWDFTNDPDVFLDEDISTQDHFHPSYSGQQKLADISWDSTWTFPLDDATTATGSHAQDPHYSDLPSPVPAPAPAADQTHPRDWTLERTVRVEADDVEGAFDAGVEDASRADSLDQYRDVIRQAIPETHEVPDTHLNDLPETACTLATGDIEGLTDAADALVHSQMVDPTVAAYLLAAAATVACPDAVDPIDRVVTN